MCDSRLKKGMQTEQREQRTHTNNGALKTFVGTCCFSEGDRRGALGTEANLKREREKKRPNPALSTNPNPANA